MARSLDATGRQTLASGARLLSADLREALELFDSEFFPLAPGEHELASTATLPIVVGVVEATAVGPVSSTSVATLPDVAGLLLARVESEAMSDVTLSEVVGVVVAWPIGVISHRRRARVAPDERAHAVDNESLRVRPADESRSRVVASDIRRARIKADMREAHFTEAA